MKINEIAKIFSNLSKKRLLNEAELLSSQNISEEEIKKRLLIIQNFCRQNDIDYNSLIQRVKNLSRYSRTNKQNSFNTAIVALSLYNGGMAGYTKHFPRFLDQLMGAINSSAETQSATVIYDDGKTEFYPDNTNARNTINSDQDLLLYRNKIMEMLRVLYGIGGKTASNYLFYFGCEYLERAGYNQIDTDSREGESQAFLLMARQARDDQNFWQILQSKFEEAKGRFLQQQQTGS